METTFIRRCSDFDALPRETILAAARRFVAEWWAEPRKIFGFRGIDGASAMFRVVRGLNTYKIALVGNRWVVDCDDSAVTRSAKRRERNATRRARDQAARDCGLVKVRGALGGTYWE